MLKYVIYRLIVEDKGNSDGDVLIKGRELVAVEYGDNIHGVTDALIKAIKDDALGLPEYQTGFEASVYPPEEENEGEYAYTVTAALEPTYGEHNDLVYYGIAVEGGTLD